MAIACGSSSASRIAPCSAFAESSGSPTSRRDYARAISRSAGDCARMRGARAMPAKPRSASLDAAFGRFGAPHVIAFTVSAERGELGIDGAAGHDPPRRPGFLRPQLFGPSSTRRSSIASMPRTGQRARWQPSRPSAPGERRSSRPGAGRSRRPRSPPLRSRRDWPGRSSRRSVNRSAAIASMSLQRARRPAARRDQRRERLLRRDPAFAGRTASRCRRAARLRLPRRRRPDRRRGLRRATRQAALRARDRPRPAAARPGSARADRSLRRRAGRATGSGLTASSRRRSLAAEGETARRISQVSRIAISRRAIARAGPNCGLRLRKPCPYVARTARP